MRKIIILGAGMCGLSSAYYLSKKGFDVTLIDKNSQVGGLMSIETLNDKKVERQYFNFFNYQNELISLCQDLGVSEKIQYNKTRTSFYFQGNFYKLDNPVDFVFFKILNLKEKAKCLMFLIKSNFVKKSNQNINTYVIKNLGQGVYDKIFQHLLKTKFGDNEKISAQFFIERFKSQTKGRNIVSEKWGYLDGTLEVLYTKLLEKLKENNAKVLLNYEIDEIDIRQKYVKVKINGNENEYDSLVSTIPLSELANIKNNFTDDEKLVLNSIDYAGVVSVLLLFENKISKRYWTNILDQESAFGVMIENSNFVKSEDHFVYLTKYFSKNSKIFMKEDNDIYNENVDSLKSIVDIRKNKILANKVFKNKYATPIYDTKYIEKLALIKKINQKYKNFYITGLYDTYYSDRNINGSIKMGKKVSKEIFK